MPAIGEARILIMATSGFEESELFGPLEMLRARGAEVRIAAPTLAPIQATVLDDPGRVVRPDLRISDARAQAYDALLLPGGVINPDTLRTNEEAITLILRFAELRKPVAAICHGPWLLVEADLLRGRRATCWPSIRADLRNAGAVLAEEPVIADGNIVTGRGPEDVIAFTEKVIALLEAEGSA